MKNVTEFKQHNDYLLLDFNETDQKTIFLCYLKLQPNRTLLEEKKSLKYTNFVQTETATECVNSQEFGQLVKLGSGG